MEAQAFGRVHRIGQEKETYFAKVVVLDSVDQRLLSMQEAKNKRISGILKEGVSDRPVPKLEELIALFGVESDENPGNKPTEGVVVVDDIRGGQEARPVPAVDTAAA
jgi:hypothetical protein